MKGDDAGNSLYAFMISPATQHSGGHLYCGGGIESILEGHKMKMVVAADGAYFGDEEDGGTCGLATYALWDNLLVLRALRFTAGLLTA